jgi:hypothetical protein
MFVSLHIGRYLPKYDEKISSEPQWEDTFSNSNCNSIFRNYIPICHEVSEVIISSSPCMKPFFPFIALEHFALPLNKNLPSQIKTHFGMYNHIHTKPKMEGIFEFLGACEGFNSVYWSPRYIRAVTLSIGPNRLKRRITVTEAKKKKVFQKPSNSNL